MLLFTVEAGLDTLPVFLIEEDVDPDTFPVLLFKLELVLALSSTVEFTFDTMPELLLEELIVLDLSLTA